MTPADLAALHARCFTVPRPWNADEISDVLSAPGAFLLLVRGGFLIGRAIAGEAELLTVAVPPEMRRQGVGRALLHGFALAAAQRGADEAFLEVASDNTAARALYAADGWGDAGRRRGYYGPGLDALVLRKPLFKDASC
ncbi:MAG: GNAT family N-acetyltransferase [Paracoccus sp. (in: a-proteobacteria)]|uniref:GNAT family N-acetyltransferase n=1 Tax=Paracoccus sp. TaxID=267 RepID=UPI0026DFC111|nr:GNAT family N-acetyltransferase [Paracoccus sp. (in: a-proteobacteria)]MDO5611661.1 GNAT family N-acetyltransferase [Paracoccus sp. (in: a-proteobacteria)]